MRVNRNIGLALENTPLMLPLLRQQNNWRYNSNS